MKTIRTGNLIIIIVLLLAAVFYFAGWFDKAKDTIKDYQTEKVSVDLQVSDSLLSVYMIKCYDQDRELEMYKEIPVGLSRISKDKNGEIILMPDYKRSLDSATLKKDSAAYFQGYNDAINLKKPEFQTFSDTTYWFISYNAKNINNVRVYSNEVVSVVGEFIIKDIVSDLEKSYSDYIKPNTIIITFYDQTTKSNYK
jgi:hypothetical protein